MATSMKTVLKIGRWVGLPLRMVFGVPWILILGICFLVVLLIIRENTEYELGEIVDQMNSTGEWVLGIPKSCLN